MRILYVSPYVPSLVRVRPYAFIRELARLGHQIILACLVHPSRESVYLADLEQYCEAIYPVYLKRFEPYLYTLISLPTQVPLSVAFCRSNDFNRLILNLIQEENIDLIHTEFLRATPATVRLKRIPKVFDAVDSLTLAYRRSLSAAEIPFHQRFIGLHEWLKVRRYEPRVLGHYNKILVSSPSDMEWMKSDHQQIDVIPNGVDLDYFEFRQEAKSDETILFLGKMSYYVNIASVLWFYRNVFPLIRQSHPNVKFKIVGRDPVSKIRALAEDPAVEVTGTVSDIRPHFTFAPLAVCPMVCGSGIQNKMLEAMAMGVPIVATSLACQALEVQSGRDLLVADTPSDLAYSIKILLDNPWLRQKMAEQGRRYVEQHHSWEMMGTRLNQIYSEVLLEQESTWIRH
jgi:sugar transferase (PEP-CTERM/EpsH1 system associated)